MDTTGKNVSDLQIARAARVWGPSACSPTTKHAPCGISVQCVATCQYLATLMAMSVEGSMALKAVKDHLSEVVDQVEREHDRVVITKHGRPAAVVVSIDDLASLEETLDVAGRPHLMRQIRSSLSELAAGEAEVLSKDEILRTLNP